MVTYVFYRRSQGLSLTETHKIELPPADRRCARLLCPVSGRLRGEHVLRHGAGDGPQARLPQARRRAWSCHARVPHHLDLHADLGAAEGVARAIIEAAASAGRPWPARAGHGREVRAGEAGHRIVAEAIAVASGSDRDGDAERARPAGQAPQPDAGGRVGQTALPRRDRLISPHIVEQLRGAVQDAVKPKGSRSLTG